MPLMHLFEKHNTETPFLYQTDLDLTEYNSIDYYWAMFDCFHIKACMAQPTHLNVNLIATE